MAAGAYKGLTIKIGGDTTGLSNALRGANSAIFKTQSELNKLNKASKLDPGNIDVASAQIGAIASQAANAAEKVSYLGQGIESLGSRAARGGGGSIAQLAKDTESVALAAEKAKIAYDGVDAKLADLYKKIKKSTGVSLRDVTNNGNFDEDFLMSLVGPVGEDGKPTKGKISAEDAKLVLALKDEWVAARAALDDYADAASLEKMNNEIAAQEAQINQLTRQLAESDRYMADAFKGLASDLEPINQRLTLVSAASDEASERFSRLDKALELDPSNMDVARERSQALSDAILTAEEKASLLQQRIDAYENSGVAKLASDMGSVSLEVEQAERAFHQANRELEEWKTTGDTTSKEFHELETAVELARDRMDTAHACQQYENLKVQLSEVTAQATNLSGEMAKLGSASSVSNSASATKLASEMDFISKALREAESDAHSFDAAIKLNPDNVEAVVLRVERLEEATRLAKEQGEQLREKYESYNVEAIKAASDYQVSAANQIIDATHRLNEAAEWVRAINAEIASLESRRDEANANGKTADVERLDKELKELRSTLKEANAEMEDAERHLDLSRQRKEVETLEVEMARNDATAERLQVTMEKLSKTDATPKFDISIADRLQNVMDQVKSGALTNSRMGGIAEQLHDVDAALNNATERFKKLDAAMKVNPENLATAEVRGKALSEAIALSETKGKLLKSALEALPSDKIDKAAIASGKLGINVADATRRFNDAKNQVKGYEDVIKELEKSIKSLEDKDIVTNDDKQKIEELNRVLEVTNKLLKETENAADDAFKEMESGDISQRFQQITTAIEENGAETKRLKDAYDGVGDAADKASQKAFSWSNAAVTAASRLFDMVSRVGREVIDSGVQVDESYRNLRKTFNAEEEDYENLYDAAMKYSQSHVTSADSMLQMEAVAAQVGVGMKGGAEGVKEFAEAAANLDVATDIASEDIALKMGQMINIMGDFDVTEVDRFSDALVRLGNNMPAQESAIMEVAQRMASQSNIIGMSTPQVLGWSAAIASTGQHSEAAATAMARTMAMIEAAVAGGTESLTKFEQQAGFSASSLRDLWNEDQASAIERVGELISSNADALDYFAQLTGQTAEEFQFAYDDKADEATLDLVAAIGKAQDKLERFAAISGKSADEFAKDWTDDPSKALQEFVQGLANIDERGESLESALADIGIKAVRQKQGIESLTKTVDILGDSITMSSDAWDGVSDRWGDAGDAAREAERKAEGLSGAMSILKNNAQVLGAEFGEALTPFVKTAAELLSGLISIVDSLPKSTKSAIAGVGGLGAAIGLLVPLVVPLAENWGKFMGAIGATSFAKAVADAGGLSSVIGRLAAGFMGLITPISVVAGGIGFLAAVLAGTYIKKAIDAYRHTKEMNAALGGMRDNANDIGRALWNGSDSVKSFGDASKTAAGKVSDLLQVVSEHNQKNAETRDTAETSIAMLGKYKEIIDECAGAGEVSAEKMSLLEWALSGLSEVTGEQYDANAILKGSYEDEEGAVHNLRDEIDKLIETKKREAKIDALKAMYTDALETQMKAEKVAQEASEKYHAAHDDWVRSVADGYEKQGMSAKEAAEAAEKAFRNGEHGYLAEEYETATKALEGLKDETQTYADAMGGVITEQMTAADAGEHVREGMMRTNEVMSQSLDAVWDGADKYEELANAIMNAGVSADDFAKINENSFAAMVEASGGDIQTLTNMIAAYNELPVEEKEASFTFDDAGLVDAEGKRLEWNGTEWVSVHTSVEVDTSKLPKAKENIDQTKKSSDQLKSQKKSVSMTGNATDGSAAKKMDAAKDSEDKLYDKSISVSASGNVITGVAAGAVSWLNTVIGQMRSKTIDLTTRNKTVNIPAGAGNSATGAYVPYNKIPKHAAGIFTRPTLTNIGWVGEDGAELYSGNSLVPLTNRKYSMPYINDISDAVAKKMGGAGSTTTITLNVSCDGGPEETANAIVRALRANRF